MAIWVQIEQIHLQFCMDDINHQHQICYRSLSLLFMTFFFFFLLQICLFLGQSLSCAYLICLKERWRTTWFVKLNCRTCMSRCPAHARNEPLSFLFSLSLPYVLLKKMNKNIKNVSQNESYISELIGFYSFLFCP